MKLAELLQPAHILLDLNETKRTVAIHRVAALLEKDEGVIHFQGFYDELLARERVEGLLTTHQQPDGSWDGSQGSESGQGRVYCTALALLSLSVRYHYLPIYQD